MSVSILRGNALALPLDDNTVDLVVTSPPYFGLRSYQDAGEHYDGQIGSEATPAEFVDALIAATAEMVRVVKPSGSIWVNLGDKYAGSAGWATGAAAEASSSLGGRKQQTIVPGKPKPDASGMRPKSLIGVPWRYALRCIDDLGLILRAEVIWSKANGLPESVTDRVRRSHETWFHFTLNPRYYSAVDEIREAATSSDRPGLVSWVDRKAAGEVMRAGDTGGGASAQGSAMKAPNPLGKLPGSVWTINEGDSFVRSVLNAVAAQAITPDEGERILWSTPRSSGVESTNPSTAGSGQGFLTVTDTADTTRSAAPTERTGSPTNSPSDLSLKVSSSTTSAATRDVYAPTTSSQSPTPSTTPESHSQQNAHEGTTTTTKTPTSGPTGNGSVEPAWPSDPGTTEHASAPPSVWQIATQPLTVPPELGVDHFAAFPMEWPRRIVTGWSPREVCTVCGEGRRPVSDRASVLEPGRRAKGLGNTFHPGSVSHHPGDDPEPVSGLHMVTTRTVTGYACACPDTTAPATPGVVLDPFGGTGTTALVAHALGRHGISVDMSADYCRLAQWRTSDPKELARAQQREYTPPREQVDGQETLFEGLGA